MRRITVVLWHNAVKVQPEGIDVSAFSPQPNTDMSISVVEGGKPVAGVLFDLFGRLHRPSVQIRPWERARA